MTRHITTSFIHPPIPCRKSDWQAYYTDEGAEGRRYGYGATEAEAVADLIDSYGDDEPQPVTDQPKERNV